MSRYNKACLIFSLEPAARRKQKNEIILGGAPPPGLESFDKLGTGLGSSPYISNEAKIKI
jgi:hypothetical protein